MRRRRALGSREKSEQTEYAYFRFGIRFQTLFVYCHILAHGTSTRCFFSPQLASALCEREAPTAIVGRNIVSVKFKYFHTWNQYCRAHARRINLH